MNRSLAPALALLALGPCACNKGAEDAKAATAAKPPTTLEEGPASKTLMKGFRPPKKWAVRPRPPKNVKDGLRALPDGIFTEWGGDRVKWIKARGAIKGASGWTGPADLDGRLALASYSGGISLALEVKDDRRRAAAYAGALDTSDHVDLQLTPVADGELSPLARRAVGLHVRLGTVRQLIQQRGEAGIKRPVSLTCTGVPTEDGYRLEAKIPLTAMAPLPGPVLKKIDFRVTLHDADEEGARAVPTVRFTGRVALDPAPRVHEAVRKRGSVRACMATVKSPLWGYWHGWRCAIPFERPTTQEEDGKSRSPLGLAFHRVPEPPRIVWIRERVLFINLPGLNRGIAALMDERKVITSLMRLGVVSAEDPGNPLSKNSGAEPFKLPDGTWAVAVTHAYPRAPGPLGGKCGGTHRVYLSVLALHRAFTSTPHKPAPQPDPPPEFKEILRVLLEDCRTTVANDWILSKDRQTIEVKSSLHPGRPAVVYDFKKGKYIKRD